MNAEAPATSTKTAPVLRSFCMLVLVLNVLSETYDAVRKYLFHLRPAYGGTFSWEDTGTDFELFRQRFAYFGTPEFWGRHGFPLTYPAPLGVVYWALYKLPHGVQVYLALSIVALLVWAWYFSAELKARGISRVDAFCLLALFAAVAWPVREALETGNMEAVMAFMLGCGVIAAWRGRWWLAAGLIGCAGSMKMYPLLLLGQVFSARRYREFCFGLAVAACFTLASLVALGPTVVEAQRHVDEGLEYITQRDGLAPLPNGMQGQHSLFNVVKIGLAMVDHATHAKAMDEASRDERNAREHAQMEAAVKVYIPFVAVLVVVMYVLWIRPMPLLNQTIALSACAVLIPPSSLDYTLINLLVPLGLLLVFAAGMKPGQRGVGVCLTCFAFIFGRNNFFELHYRFASEIRTIALLVLLTTVLKVPFAEPEAWVTA